MHNKVNHQEKSIRKSEQSPHIYFTGPRWSGCLFDMDKSKDKKERRGLHYESKLDTIKLNLNANNQKENVSRHIRIERLHLHLQREEEKKKKTPKYMLTMQR